MPIASNDELGYKPLDGGWGWVVVFGAHIAIGFAYAMPKALSIFYNDIQEDLECSSSEIALMSSIMLAVMYAGGEFIQSLFVYPHGEVISIISSITVNKQISHSLLVLYCWLVFVMCITCALCLSVICLLNLLLKGDALSVYFSIHIALCIFSIS